MGGRRLNRFADCKLREAFREYPGGADAFAEDYDLSAWTLRAFLKRKSNRVPLALITLISMAFRSYKERTRWEPLSWPMTSASMIEYEWRRLWRPKQPPDPPPTTV